MTKKIKYLAFLLILNLFASCSFDNKSGIWSGSEVEKKRISELEKEQNRKIDVVKIYSTKSIFLKIKPKERLHTFSNRR